MGQLLLRIQRSFFYLVTSHYRVSPSCFTVSFNSILNSMRSPRERDKQEAFTPLSNVGSSSTLPTSTVLHSPFVEDTSFDGEQNQYREFFLLLFFYVLILKKSDCKWYSILRTYQHSEQTELST